jgi:hypothetical protein
MKKLTLFGTVLGLLLLAGGVWACCGSSWTAPPPPPPPAPAPGSVTPALNVDVSTESRDNVYKVTSTSSKDWRRPSIANEFGIYSFSTLNGVQYYKVETNDGSVYMTRY